MINKCNEILIAAESFNLITDHEYSINVDDLCNHDLIYPLTNIEY